MIFNNVVLSVTNASDIEEVRALLSEQAKLSIQEPGCARFEVYHSQSDRSVFILVEQWETDADLDAHREAKAFTEIYIPKVLPLLTRVPHPSDRVWPE